MIRHYLATALIRFRQAPLVSAMNVLALALGLTAFLGAHVVGDYVYGADRHWRDAGRIVAFVQSFQDTGMAAPEEMPATAHPLSRYLRLDFPELEAVARLGPSGFVDVSADGRSANLPLRQADPEILQIFDLPFVEGDPLRALDAPDAVILSQAGAQRLFGDAPALGRGVLLDGEVEATVTGVVGAIPSPSVVGSPPLGTWDAMLSTTLRDRLIALQFGAPDMRMSEMDNWPQPSIMTYALLPADGSLTLRELNARLPAFAARRVPPEQGEAAFRAEPVWAAMARTINNDYLQGPAGLSLTRVFYAFGALVLAVACLNVANLTTAQAVRRSKETGLRKAVGAGRAQIALHALTESALLIAAALILATLLIAAALGTGPARALGLGPEALLRPGFLAGAGLALAATVALTGAWPGLALANVRPLAAQRAGTVSGGGLARSLMTGAQFAAAGGLLLIVSVMLMQNAMMRRTGLGAQQDPLVMVTAQLSPPAHQAMRTELLSHPAILGASASNARAFDDSLVGTQDISLADDEDSPQIAVRQRNVWADYFETVGVRIVAGRDFSEEQDAAAFSGGSPRSIIDAATAERLGLTPSEAVGRTIDIGRFGTVMHEGKVESTRLVYPSRIIGVAESAPFELRRRDPANFVYTLTQSTGLLVVRVSRENVSGALEHLDASWARMQPDQPMERHFLDELFDQAFADFNRISAAIMILALVAVAIAAMGVFGMSSFTAAQRVREIGVRKTLGAPTARVLAMMIWDFSRPVLIANIVALPVAWLAARLYLDLFITRIGLTPAPFLIAFLASLLIAWLAVGGQAWAAARVRPAAVLRSE